MYKLTLPSLYLSTRVFAVSCQQFELIKHPPHWPDLGPSVSTKKCSGNARAGKYIFAILLLQISQ